MWVSNATNERTFPLASVWPHNPQFDSNGTHLDFLANDRSGCVIFYTLDCIRNWVTFYLSSRCNLRLVLKLSTVSVAGLLLFPNNDSFLHSFHFIHSKVMAHIPFALKGYSHLGIFLTAWKSRSDRTADFLQTNRTHHVTGTCKKKNIVVSCSCKKIPGGNLYFSRISSLIEQMFSLCLQRGCFFFVQEDEQNFLLSKCTQIERVYLFFFCRDLSANQLSSVNRSMFEGLANLQRL